jgi:superfamily II DNA or RNA helicase
LIQQNQKSLSLSIHCELLKHLCRSIHPSILIQLSNFRMITLRKSCLGPERLDELRRKLTVETKNYHDDEITKTIFYSENNETITVPRFTPGCPKAGPEHLPNVGKQDFPTQGLTFNGKLRESDDNNQVAAANKTYYDITTHGGTVLNMLPGKGKSIVMIHTMVRTGKRWLIFVNGDKIIKQWNNYLLQYISPPPKIGLIQGKICIWQGCDFVLVSLKTLTEDKSHIPKEALQAYGRVYDECHHIPAPTFSFAFNMAQSLVTTGLSGTVDRPDGKGPIIFALLGPLGYNVSDTPLIRQPDDQRVQVTCIRYNGGIQKEHIMRSRWKGKRDSNNAPIANNKKTPDKKLNFAKMYDDLATDVKRNILLVKVINMMAMMDNSTRKGLCFGRFNKHLKTIYALMDNPSTTEIMSGAVKTDKAKAKRKEMTFTSPITFSTYDSCGEAVDFPGDYVVYMAPPRGGATGISQSAGRLTRGHNTGNRPMLIDIWDGWSCWKNMAFTRLRTYKELGFDVVFIDESDLPD